MAKQQKYLIIAILIPIVMILIIALSLLIPTKKISPPYNLLYATGDNTESYTCLQNMGSKFFPQKNADFYKVEKDSCKQVQLFIYDFNSDTSQSITFEKAKKLNVKEILSPGIPKFYVSRNCYDGPDIGLWSMRETYNDVCLIKDDYKRLLNINPQHSKRQFYFYSIGWILPNESAPRETKQ